MSFDSELNMLKKRKKKKKKHEENMAECDESGSGEYEARCFTDLKTIEAGSPRSSTAIRAIETVGANDDDFALSKKEKKIKRKHHKQDINESEIALADQGELSELPKKKKKKRKHHERVINADETAEQDEKPESSDLQKVSKDRNNEKGRQSPKKKSSDDQVQEVIPESSSANVMSDDWVVSPTPKEGPSVSMKDHNISEAVDSNHKKRKKDRHRFQDVDIYHGSQSASVSCEEIIFPSRDNGLSLGNRLNSVGLESAGLQTTTALFEQVKHKKKHKESQEKSGVVEMLSEHVVNSISEIGVVDNQVSQDSHVSEILVSFKKKKSKHKDTFHSRDSKAQDYSDVNDILSAKSSESITSDILVPLKKKKKNKKIHIINSEHSCIDSDVSHTQNRKHKDHLDQEVPNTCTYVRDELIVPENESSHHIEKLMVLLPETESMEENMPDIIPSSQDVTVPNSQDTTGMSKKRRKRKPDVIHDDGSQVKRSRPGACEASELPVEEHAHPCPIKSEPASDSLVEDCGIVAGYSSAAAHDMLPDSQGRLLGTCVPIAHSTQISSSWTANENGSYTKCKSRIESTTSDLSNVVKIVHPSDETDNPVSCQHDILSGKNNTCNSEIPPDSSNETILFIPYEAEMPSTGAFTAHSDNLDTVSSSLSQLHPADRARSLTSSLHSADLNDTCPPSSGASDDELADPNASSDMSVVYDWPKPKPCQDNVADEVVSPRPLPDSPRASSPAPGAGGQSSPYDDSVSSVPSVKNIKKSKKKKKKRHKQDEEEEVIVSIPAPVDGTSPVCVASTALNRGSAADENADTPTPQVTDENVDTPTAQVNEVMDGNVNSPTPQVTDENVDTPTPQVTDENVDTPTPQVTDENVDAQTPLGTEENGDAQTTQSNANSARNPAIENEDGTFMYHEYNSTSYRKFNNIKPRLDELGIKLRMGPWAKKEDDQLRKNFARFFEIRPVACPYSYLNYSKNASFTREMKNEIRSNIKEYKFYTALGRGIERPLYSIYSRAVEILHPDHRRGTFTAEESEQLLELVEQYGKKWTHIAQEMGRTAAAVRDHARRKLKEGNKKPKHGKWRLKEDRNLIRLMYNAYGQNCYSGSLEHLSFTEIAQKMRSRSYSQIRDRWLMCLGPRCRAAQEHVQATSQATCCAWGTEENVCLLESLQRQREKRRKDVDWEKVKEDMGNNFSTRLLRTKLRDWKTHIPKDIRKKLTLKNILRYVEENFKEKWLKYKKSKKLRDGFEYWQLERLLGMLESGTLPQESQQSQEPVPRSTAKKRRRRRSGSEEWLPENQVRKTTKSTQQKKLVQKPTKPTQQKKPVLPHSKTPSEVESNGESSDDNDPSALPVFLEQDTNVRKMDDEAERHGTSRPGQMLSSDSNSKNNEEDAARGSKSPLHTSRSAAHNISSDEDEENEETVTGRCRKLLPQTSRRVAHNVSPGRDSQSDEEDAMPHYKTPSEVESDGVSSDDNDPSSMPTYLGQDSDLQKIDEEGARQASANSESNSQEEDNRKGHKVTSQATEEGTEDLERKRDRYRKSYTKTKRQSNGDFSPGTSWCL